MTLKIIFFVFKKKILFISYRIHFNDERIPSKEMKKAEKNSYKFEKSQKNIQNLLNL